jgi:hypothetical protein
MDDREEKKIFFSFPLEQWPAGEPPAGFADGVLAARRRPMARRVIAIGASIAAGVLLASFLVSRGDASGSVDARERTTVQLGVRGVAVAEEGSSLHWSVSRGGSARIAQNRGDVFYRVEPGKSFVVSAPGADITVTGTCFRVEVIPMVKSIVSATAGAAVASAVLVTVYEGKVRVAGPAGATDVAAGEQARAEPGAAPRIVSRTTAPALLAPSAQTDYAHESRDQLVERSKQDRAQIASLQGRVRELEGDRAQLLAKAEKRASKGGGDDENAPPGMPPLGKFHGFTPDELKAMAQQCEVRMDVPPLDRKAWSISPDLGARLHLADDEQGKVTAAVNAVRASAIARLRALYIEATGDQNGADSLDPGTLGREILHKSPEAVVGAARARVAREKAGMETPPADPDSGNLPERYFRMMTSLGDALETNLQPLGAQQASSLRDKLTPQKMVMNGCDESGK